MPPFNTPTKKSLAAATACVLALGAGAGSAVADTVNPKPGVQIEATPFSYLPAAERERMLGQQPLKDAADVIDAAAQADLAATGSSGFTSISLADDSVVVHWKGAVPAGVRAAIDAADDKVRVDLVPARFAHAELDRAVRLVQETLRAAKVAKAFAVDSAVDGSGLIVETEGTALAVKLSLPLLGIPVEIVRTQVSRTQGRYNDWAPFYGGAAILAEGGRCTAGWPVTNGYQTFMLTAGHCGRPGAAFYNGNGSRLIGTAAHEDVWQDLLLIPANVGPYIYDGPLGAGEFIKHIYGWSNTYDGEYTCMSGSTSGIVCGSVVDGGGNYSLCDNDGYGNYECYGGLYRAYNDDRVPSQDGDSGGPVFSLYGSNYAVVAEGTVVGGNNDDKLLFQDIRSANQTWAVVPIA